MNTPPLTFTLRPVFHRFADIAAVYRYEGLAVPEDLEDAWEKLERIEAHAFRQLAIIEGKAVAARNR
jgi:hypothetical protein